MPALDLKERREMATSHSCEKAAAPIGLMEINPVFARVSASF